MKTVPYEAIGDMPLCLACHDAVYADVVKKGYKILQPGDFIAKKPKDPEKDADGNIVLKGGQIWYITNVGPKVHLIFFKNDNYVAVDFNGSFYNDISEELKNAKFLANNMQEYLANGGKIE